MPSSATDISSQPGLAVADTHDDPGALRGVGDRVVDEIGHSGDELRLVAQHHLVLAPGDHHDDLLVLGGNRLRSRALVTTAATSTGWAAEADRRPASATGR